MEEGYIEKRLAGFRKFLDGFVGDKDSPIFQEDPIQFRGSIVGSYRVHASDVPAEILDWVLLFLYQRKCPHDLAWVLAREVQARVEAILPTCVPPMSNGGTNDADSPDEELYLLDSSVLYNEMLKTLQEVCYQFCNSEAELAQRISMLKCPQYQTSVVAVKNTRRKMEDRHVVIPDLNALCGLVDGPPQSYYAVFDGHSGVEAASFCSAHLHWNLVQHPKFECDPKVALKEAFATTEEQFLHRSQREGIKSGCTAVCCLIRDRTFYLAWLGDSQAFLVKKGMPHFVMSPHKPERVDEKERVEKLGGCVMHVGTWRVNGILAVSRALGDFEHKPCISSEPDIIQQSLDGEEDFLVLACDGLWDTLSANDVTAAVYHFINQESDDVDDIAAQVAQQAIERGSTDNVTVIIVFLRDLQTLAAQSAVTSFSNESTLNHSSNPFGEFDNRMNVFDTQGAVIENGDDDHIFHMKMSEASRANGREDVFQQHTSLMPEATSISELPTPPIEDVIDAEGLNRLENKSKSMNPFESQENAEVHDSHAKEIASAILNSALESAAHVDGEKIEQEEKDGLLPATQLFTTEQSAFFSGQIEVNAPLEAVAENNNAVGTTKPWVLQVEHSNNPDEVDYLPSSDYIVGDISQQITDFPKYMKDELVSFKEESVDTFASFQESAKEEHISYDFQESELVRETQVADHLDDQILTTSHRIQSISQTELESGYVQDLSEEIPESEIQSVPLEIPVQPDLQMELVNAMEAMRLEQSLGEEPSESHFAYSGEVQEQELSPEMLKEAQRELEDVQSKLLQSVQELSDLKLLSDVPIMPEEQNVSGFELTSEFSFQTTQQRFDTEVLQNVSEQVDVKLSGESEFTMLEQKVKSQQMTSVLTSFEDQAGSTVPPNQNNDDQSFDQFTDFGEEHVQFHNFNPFGQPVQSDDMFGFAEETPSTLRSLQCAPEMMGISEVVPGIQTSEPLVALEPKKGVLAAFEDILVPSSPDTAPAMTVTELLEPQSMKPDEITIVGSSQEILNLMESVPAPPADTPSSIPDSAEIQVGEVTTTQVIIQESTVPVQNSLLVDFIAPQMAVPELTDPEAVANLLASDVPPTPEVVLEKIPDGVPEADGVTEDSDSEKDGGWSYVSTKAKEPGMVESPGKTKVAADTSTVKRASTSSKEPSKTYTLSKTSSTKSAENKVKAKPAPAKQTTPSASATLKKATSESVKKTPTETIKKPPTETIKKPPSSTLVKSKPQATTTSLVGKVTATKTNTVSSSSSTVTKEIMKSSTISRPASTLSKKTTPTPKPATTTAAKTTPTTTTTKTSTMKLARPAAATTTAAKPAAPAASTRPASSTLNRPGAKPSTTRPATTTTTTTATLTKKAPTTAASKPSTVPTRAPASIRPSPGTMARTQKTPTEPKQTKDTVNKQLLNQPGTLRNKPTSTLSTKTSNKTISSTAALAKSSTRTSTGSKTLKPAATSIKAVTKPVAKGENNEVPKTENNEPAKPEPEKGALEDKGKDNHAVDSGLASPESPVSPQLSLVNGNHQGDAPIEEKTAVLEQAELN